MGEQLYYAAVDAQGHWVALDALHTQDETARQLVLEHGAHHLLTVKNNQPTLRQNIENSPRGPAQVFPPLTPTPTQARTVEQNKGVQESRTIETRAVAAENMGFPFAAQVARLTRQHAGRKDETAGLLTDLTRRTDPCAWLRANWQGWGIENSSHQRLDVSLNDDRCRVCSPNGQWILGMMNRLVISLFMEWRHRQPKPHCKSRTDFQAALGEDNLSKALDFVTRKHAKL